MQWDGRLVAARLVGEGAAELYRGLCLMGTCLKVSRGLGWLLRQAAAGLLEQCFATFGLADIASCNLHIHTAAAYIHKGCGHSLHIHMTTDSTLRMMHTDFDRPLRIASIHTNTHRSSWASGMLPCTVAVHSTASCCTWPASAWSSLRTRRRPMQS